MTTAFDRNKVQSYRNMSETARGILVWLEHMMDKKRSIIDSLKAQAMGYEPNFKLYQNTVDSVVHDHPAMPQSKYYLAEVNERMFQE